MNGISFECPVHECGGFRLAPGQVTPPAGKVTVLLGANGSGKTTALRLAAGAIRPVAGAVLLDGRPAHAFPAAERAARVSIVVQRPEVGAPFLVHEVVRLGAVRSGEGRAAIAARVESALARAGLSDAAGRQFRTLSGGQQQRVAVARAFAQHRPGGILLLDEAFSAVDPPEAASLVRELQAEARAGATVLLATHDLAIASAIADHAWLLRDGGTRCFAPAASALEPESLGRFLGVRVAAAAASGGRVLAADFTAILSPDQRR